MQPAAPGIYSHPRLSSNLCKPNRLPLCVPSPNTVFRNELGDCPLHLHCTSQPPRWRQDSPSPVTRRAASLVKRRKIASHARACTAASEHARPSHVCFTLPHYAYELRDSSAADVMTVTVTAPCPHSRAGSIGPDSQPETGWRFTYRLHGSRC